MIPASYAPQSARDWRMISSSSALESPPPKSPVRGRQKFNAKAQRRKGAKSQHNKGESFCERSAVFRIPQAKYVGMWNLFMIDIAPSLVRNENDLTWG